MASIHWMGDQQDRSRRHLGQNVDVLAETVWLIPGGGVEIPVADQQIRRLVAKAFLESSQVPRLVRGGDPPATILARSHHGEKRLKPAEQGLGVRLVHIGHEPDVVIGTMCSLELRFRGGLEYALELIDSGHDVPIMPNVVPEVDDRRRFLSSMLIPTPGFWHSCRVSNR